MSMRRTVAIILAILGLGILVAAVFIGLIYLKTKTYIYPGMRSLPSTQVAVIPGAAILKNGDLSPILKDRVDVAITLYVARKVSKILVTGNDSETDNEVVPVRKYLLAEGIPPQDIFIDFAGFDTYSSMYRAKMVFNVTSMVVVSQSFHLPRAVYIARYIGIDAYGLSSDIGHIIAYNYAREIFADIKAVTDLIFARKPKYLGPIIPINGDGRESLK